MGFYHERNIYIKLNDVTVELGDKLPEEITRYMELLPNDSNLSMESNVLLDKDGYTTTIGKFAYYLVYNNDDYKFSQMTNVKSSITVVDTVDPVIEVKNNIKIKYNGKINTSDVAVCYDLSGCKISWDKEIDTTKSGKYEVTVKAIDGGGNITYDKATITVLEKPKPVVVYNSNPYSGVAYSSMNTMNNQRNEALSEEEKSSLRMQVVNFAKQFIGNPYVYGGTSLTRGTDCSGFTMSVYANFGYALPRVASHQAAVGKAVSASELLPGDIIVYTYGHVGIYVGNGMMVHAGTSATGIVMQPMFEGYRVYRRIIF